MLGDSGHRRTQKGSGEGLSGEAKALWEIWYAGDLSTEVSSGTAAQVEKLLTRFGRLALGRSFVDFGRLGADRSGGDIALRRDPLNELGEYFVGHVRSLNVL